MIEFTWEIVRDGVVESSSSECKLQFPNGVFVDEMQPCVPNKNWKYSENCHMFTFGNLRFLHALADAIGLKREWFQDPFGSMPHYDLTASRRAVALRLGAKPATRDDLALALAYTRVVYNLSVASKLLAKKATLELHGS